MKFCFLVIFMFFLSGCELVDDDSSSKEGEGKILSFNGTDLSGTWLSTIETRETKIATDEYLSSDYFESQYILEDTNRGVVFNECWEYGGIETPYGIKTDQHFYMNTQESGFTLQADGSLQQSTIYEREYSPGLSYEAIQTLTRLSDEVDLDSGTFVLRGPVSVEEYSHVCTFINTSNIGNTRTYQLTIPYDNGYINFSLRLIGNVSTGTYVIDDYYNENAVVIDIYSNSTLFEQTMNSAGVGYQNAAVNIIELNDHTISGSFEIVDENGIEHTGEFEMLLNH